MTNRYLYSKAGTTSGNSQPGGINMAAYCGLSEQDLKCFLCREHYTLPKQLPCMHSFCSRCLEDYVASTFRQTRSVRFPCPVCATATEPPDPELHRTPGEFVKDYNDNYLADSVKNLDLTYQPDDRCLRHPDYLVEYFCNTCKKALCGACKRDHVTCSVEPLEGKDPKKLRKDCTQDILINATTLRHDIKVAKKAIEPRAREILTDKAATSAKIKAYFADARKKFLQALQEQEDALQKELDRLSAKKQGRILDNESLCSALIGTLDVHENMLQAIGVKNKEETSEIAVLQVHGEIIGQIGDVKNTVSKINQTINTKSPQFVVDKEVETNYKTKLGKIVVEGEPEVADKPHSERESTRSLPEMAVRPYSPVPAGKPAPYYPKVSETDTPDVPPLKEGKTLCSFQPHNEDDPRVSSVVGLAWYRDNILVLDRWNSRMSVYRGEALINSVSFQDYEPWDVAILSEADDIGICMVTLPKAKTLLKIEIENESGKSEIVAVRTTTFGYTCVTCNLEEANLICGCCFPFAAPEVHIVDFYGQILKQFSLDSNLKPIFSYPRSVDVTANGVIVVCDWNLNALVFLKTDGHVIGQYKGTLHHPLKDPMGTTLDSRGHVLVADRKSRTIHIVTLNGQFVDVIHTDVDLVDPREIAVNATGGVVRLAVSNEAMRSAQGSAVQVLELTDISS